MNRQYRRSHPELSTLQKEIMRGETHVHQLPSGPPEDPTLFQQCSCGSWFRWNGAWIKVSYQRRMREF